MRNPYITKLAIAAIIGCFCAIAPFFLVSQDVVPGIIRRLGGGLVLPAIVVLFMPKYRPWGIGYIAGYLIPIFLAGMSSVLRVLLTAQQ